MNDRLQALLDAERAAAATIDDEAFKARVVGRLREVAIVGAGVGLATSVPAAAATTTSTSATTSAAAATTAATTAAATTATTAATTATVATTGALAGLGLVKVAGIAGVVASLSVASFALVERAPSTTSAVVVAPPAQASAPTPVAAVPAFGPDLVEGPAPSTTTEAVAAPVVAPVVAPVIARPAPRPRIVDTHTAPPSSGPTELERYDEAVAALRGGRVDDAATLFAGLLAAYPRGVLRPEAQMSLLESLYRAGRFAAVVEAVPVALRDVDDVRALEVHRLAGDALVQLGRCDEARTAYQAARPGGSRLSVDDVSAALLACQPR